jgi:hypothetical protein
LPRLSNSEPIRIRSTLAGALSAAEVNDVGRTTGQAERLRTATAHRLLLAIVSTLPGEIKWDRIRAAIDAAQACKA